MSEKFHHRSTLSQKNKPFKSKHATKGSLKKSAGGRVENNVRNAGKNAALQKKEERRNLANQQRKNKIQKQIQKKRALATGEAPPRLVGVILLGEIDNVSEILQNLRKEGEKKNEEMSLDHSTENFTIYSSKWKTRLSFHFASRETNAILDIGKVAEVLLCLVPKTGIDEKGKTTLRILQAQGFGSIILSLDSENKLQLKKLKKKIIDEYFPDIAKSVKAIDLTNYPETIRTISQIGTTASPISRYLQRGFIIPEKTPELLSLPNNENTLQVYGYIRGGSISANQLVHIPGYGDFQLRSIIDQTDICPIPKSTPQSDVMATNQSESGSILHVADEKQESLQSENTPDPLEGEQNIDFEDEDDDILNDLSSSKKKKKLPKGTSNYQACWIVEDDDEEAPVLKDDEGDDQMKSDNDEDNNEIDEESEEEEDNEGMNEDDIRKKQQEEDILYPDEVDTPADITTRERYQKYRGLKSFRSSPWDMKENLPREYSKIYQFRNFTRTSQRVITEISAAGVPEGKYVILQIANVPPSILQHNFLSHPFVVFSLYPYEQKTSVINFTIQRNNDFTDTIQSKEPLIFHYGFRRLKVNPVYSEHTLKIDKHKYERFLQPSSTSVATIYGPITFPPSSLLVFREKTVDNHTELEYVAKGSLLNVDPDRLIIKKIVVTGHPFRITKKKAVVRKMFFNSEDVNWFKPVELRTKLGRTGHILCSLGTHGYMKCQFDAQLQPHDTILMNLYKRVYPSWKSSLYSS